MADRASKVLTYQEAYEMALRAGSRFPAVVAAQFALETDWGRKTANAKNNLFNLKWNEGAAKRLRERGIVVNKASKPAKDNMTGSMDHYMEFESIEDAFFGYQNFIETNPRYSKALEANNAREYVEGIKAAGYAEDPNYVKSIDKIARGAGYNLAEEARYNDEAIEGYRKKGAEEIARAGDDMEKRRDGIPKIRRINSPGTRANIMSKIDFSQSTVNDRQYDRMEMFIGKNLAGEDTSGDISAEEQVAKAALEKSTEADMVEEAVETPLKYESKPFEGSIDLGLDNIDQEQQAEGGVQPNGRQSTFSREEDLQAQDNTYKPLKLF